MIGGIATRAYQERYGKPVAFDSDKHGVFRVNRKDAIGGDGMTQFGRAPQRRAASAAAAPLLCG
jgi:hypothetical protein